MQLPFLTELNTSRDVVEVFGGYNHNIRISENEFYDMQNLTSSAYPTIAPRKQRGVFYNCPDNEYIVGIIEKDALCEVVYVA